MVHTDSKYHIDQSIFSNIDCHYGTNIVMSYCTIIKVGGTKERLVLLDAFLCSVFTYCPTTWHFCSKTVEKMMEKIYERSLRFVMNDPSRSYEELLMITKCDTMFLWRLKKNRTFMYKCFYRLHPKYINDMFNVKEMPYSIRDDLKFILPKFNTKTYG